MFVLVAVACCWLGYNLNFIHKRHAIRKSIEEQGGTVEVFLRPEPIETVVGNLTLSYLSYQRAHGPEIEPDISKWRRWLGDEAVNQIMMPRGTSATDLQGIRAIFPECEVDVMETMETKPGSGMF